MYIYACVADATTLYELADLRHTHPTTWYRKMQRHSAGRAQSSWTVEEALRKGCAAACLPTDASDAAARRLKKPRHCARRLMAVYGSVRIQQISEAWLRHERLRQARSGKLSKSTDVTGACFTLLRQLVAASEGPRCIVQPKLRPRPRPRLPRPMHADRSHPQRTLFRDVERMLKALTTVQRVSWYAILLLQRHVGVSPGRVRALRWADINPYRRRVTFASPKPGWTPLVYPLPDEVFAVLRKMVRRGRWGRPEALLFPKRGDPNQPMTSPNRRLLGRARKLGYHPVTQADVRKLAQRDLRLRGACRAQVRGTFRRSLQRDAVERGVQRIEQGWSEPMDRGKTLPRRAPPRRAAGAMEWRPEWLGRPSWMSGVSPGPRMDGREAAMGWGGPAVEWADPAEEDLVVGSMAPPLEPEPWRSKLEPLPEYVGPVAVPMVGPLVLGGGRGSVAEQRAALVEGAMLGVAGTIVGMELWRRVGFS